MGLFLFSSVDKFNHNQHNIHYTQKKFAKRINLNACTLLSTLCIVCRCMLNAIQFLYRSECPYRFFFIFPSFGKKSRRVFFYCNFHVIDFQNVYLWFHRIDYIHTAPYLRKWKGRFERKALLNQDNLAVFFLNLLHFK